MQLTSQNKKTKTCQKPQDWLMQNSSTIITRAGLKPWWPTFSKDMDNFSCHSCNTAVITVHLWAVCRKLLSIHHQWLIIIQCCNSYKTQSHACHANHETEAYRTSL